MAGRSEFIRHEMPTGEPQLAVGDEALIDAVTAHFERFFPGEHSCFHELISTHVHIDVYIIPPEPGRLYWILYTSGMAQLPMSTPRGHGDIPAFAEVMLKLDPTWDLGFFERAPATEPSEDLYWPVRALKTLARLPHEFQSWLGDGHTVPNGPDAEPFAPSTRLGCMLALDAGRFDYPASFETVRVPGRPDVHLLQLVALHPSEMHLKVEQGTDALLAAFGAVPQWDVIRAQRPNAVPGYTPQPGMQGQQGPPKRKKRFGLF